MKVNFHDHICHRSDCSVTRKGQNYASRWTPFKFKPSVKFHTPKNTCTRRAREPSPHLAVHKSMLLYLPLLGRFAVSEGYSQWLFNNVGSDSRPHTEDRKQILRTKNYAAIRYNHHMQHLMSLRRPITNKNGTQYQFFNKHMYGEHISVDVNRKNNDLCRNNQHRSKSKSC